MTPASKRSTPTDAAEPVTATRILGNPVPPLVPARGPVHVLLVGEAPGPRGADKSGVPFFGDAAGQHLYAALRDLGAVTLPPEVDDLPWDGEIFADGGLRPVAHGIALGNAYDRCPTDDGISFRAPSRRELGSEENIARLAADIERFAARGLRGIVSMGRVAATTIDLVLKHAPMPDLERRAVVHPSARGLLSLLPHRGTGVKMSELQERWKVMCTEAVREAGYPA
jgi:hypothetical protein